ncbi:class F sortase [Nonomuraea sp. NPDC050663]|uniref:class F sortase n=1 Tax=Nonomuraea sp. NPDC050663 TaxID=3364370 RepID=UPI00379AE87F
MADAEARAPRTRAPQSRAPQSRAALTRAALALAGLALLLVATTACKAQDRATVGPLTLPATVKAGHWPRQVGETSRWARPVRVMVPRLKIDAPVTGIGSGEKGRLEAPPLGETNLVGWDRQSPVPGNPGAAVLVGHLDTKTGPAVFARLREVKPGDTLAVVRSDDQVVVYRATATQEVGKADFPVRKVFTSSGAPAIRLVTCGGRYDHDRGSYDDNLIVYGEHAGTYRAVDLRKGVTRA